MITVGASILCGLSVVPVRIEASDISEMVSQLLFGETASVIETKEQWLKIHCHHDNYEGWVDSKQFLLISKQDVAYISECKRQQDEFAQIHTPWGIQTILQGTPILSEKSAFILNGYPFHWKEKVPNIYTKDIGILTNSYLNAPYLWGGRTKFGIDCSGFSQIIMQQLGVYIERDASQQYKQGKEIYFGAQKTGDLVFFSKPNSVNVTHVGIVLPHNKIIHAHGRVRIDTLNEKGIYNEKEKYYSHHFVTLKRLLNQ